MNFSFIGPHYELELPTLDARDAALISDCYSHHFDAHEFVYNFPSAAERSCVVNPNHQHLREFIENFIRPPLRDSLLNVSPYVRYRNCIYLLMRHNCNIENSCRTHLELILKLRIIAAPCISANIIDSDFQLFVNYRYDWDLMVCYIKRFSERLHLILYIFVRLPRDAKQYFMESAVPDFYQYILSYMDTIIHFLVTRIFTEQIEFCITYGARNVDNPDVYEMYATQMLDIELPVNSRIKMRVLQVYAMAFDNVMTMRMLMAANMEPLLTKQQYQAVLNEFIPILSEDPDAQVILQQSWKWYSNIFDINDNAMLTPRSLKHICRYVIRCNMARNNQLPHGIASLTLIPDSIKHYLSLTDWEIQLSKEVYLRRAF